MQKTQTQTLSQAQQCITDLKNYLDQCIIGQEVLVERLLIVLIADGHLLVEGAPGLAKTTAIKTLAECVEGSFARIQFTPDLLPGDLTGTEIFHPQDGSFSFQQGPIFHNLVLADEINRAPAKVQSALLEAMAERQITVGKTTYELPPLFLVMATQNPIEQEGTYPLPEAQLDRFLMYVTIDYPDANSEQRILNLVHEQTQQNYQQNNAPRFNNKLSQQAIHDMRQAVLNLHISDALQQYIVQLVVGTRSNHRSDNLNRWIRFGASPRATISLARCARARAWLHGRDYVSPEDIHGIAYEVLRHRVLLSYEAEAEGITPDHVISELLQLTPIP